MPRSSGYALHHILLGLDLMWMSETTATKKLTMHYSHAHGAHTLVHICIIQNCTWIHQCFLKGLLELLALDVPALCQVSVHLIANYHNATYLLPSLEGIRSLLWPFYCGQLSHLLKIPTSIKPGQSGIESFIENERLQFRPLPLNFHHHSFLLATSQTHWAS